MTSLLPGWILEWWSSWAALAAGGAAGAAYLFATRGRSTASADVEAEIAEAERHKEILVEQLRELTEERHKVGEARYLEERTRLEEAAAQALRARDSVLARARRKAPGRKPAAGTAGWLAAHPQARGALWGAGAVIVVVAIVLSLRGAEGPRPQDVPMTRTPPQMAPVDPPQDAALQALIQAVERSPKDVAALNRLGHELLYRQALMESAEIAEQVLRLDPIDVEARAHRAAIKSARGDDEGALADLAHLTTRYPKQAEPLLFQGLVLRRLNRKALAVESLEKYVALAPDAKDAAEVRALVREMKDGQRGP